VAARLRGLFREQVVPAMMKRFGYRNAMQVPRIEKVVVSMGVGEAIQDSKVLDAAVADLALLTGQRPIITRARKSVAAFKVRAGMPIGCKVTLRGERMYDFLDKLFNIALPRVRDFRGLSLRSFDGRGNFALGLKDQIVFPEVNYDEVEQIRGMNIVITTTAETDEEGVELLRLLGLPFREAA